MTHFKDQGLSMKFLPSYQVYVSFNFIFEGISNGITVMPDPGKNFFSLPLPNLFWDVNYKDILSLWAQC